jgi:ATP-dependent exoDNAse (exonuclease V) alpha subunit
VKLSDKQEAALTVLEAGHNVFLSGVAGTGKSSILREWLRRTKKNVGVTAFTGIAATHIDGQTTHSFLGVGPFSTVIGTVKTDRFTDMIQPRVRAIDALIIDEISLVDGKTIELFSGICSAATGDPRPFGGIQTIFVGDMGQLAPVHVGTPDPSYCFTTDVWKELQIVNIELGEVFRQADKVFVDLLRNLRFGWIDEDSKRLLSSRVNAFDPDAIPEPIRLVVLRKTAEEINNRRLAKIKNTELLYTAMDIGPPSVLEKLDESCLSPRELRLKVGARVMFTKNDINYTKDYEGRITGQLPPRFCNGSQGYVTSMQPGLVSVRLDNGNEITTGPLDWTFKAGTETVLEKDESGEDVAVTKQLTATRVQIPLMLAFAITGHKSQGSTLDRVSIDISDCFDFGQAYVMLSRVRSLENLNIEKPIRFDRIKAHPSVVKFMKNIFEERKKRDENPNWASLLPVPVRRAATAKQGAAVLSAVQDRREREYGGRGNPGRNPEAGQGGLPQEIEDGTRAGRTVSRGAVTTSDSPGFAPGAAVRHGTGPVLIHRKQSDHRQSAFVEYTSDIDVDTDDIDSFDDKDCIVAICNESQHETAGTRKRRRAESGD